MKIISVACGKKYHHMIPPFLNSALRAGYEPTIYTDIDIPYGENIAFNNRGDKVDNMLSRNEIWKYAVKKHGACLCLDIDMIILKPFTLPDADCVFTLDRRFTEHYDYINLGFLYVRHPMIMYDLVDHIGYVDKKRAVKPPYLAIDQMAFHQMIGFKNDVFKYEYNGLTIIGVPCDTYNHYDDRKPVKDNCAILHYKNRWQGGPDPASDKMEIINDYLDTPLRGKDILGKT
jgi:hypothetical protein